MILLLFILPLVADVMIFLPPVDFEPGWIFDFEPEIYRPANLHEYINGEAELYKQYDVVEMATASYVHKENPSLTFTIDIYDMGTTLNAFGIYSYYRRPDMNFAEIGEQAVVSDLSVRFWQGRYFVNIVAGGLDSSLTQKIRDVAARMSSTLPRLPRPAIFNDLPKIDQIPNSLKYIKSSYLNVENITALQARYKKHDDTCIMFLIYGKNDSLTKECFFQLKQDKTIRVKMSGDKIYGVREFSSAGSAEYFLNRLY